MHTRAGLLLVVVCAALAASASIIGFYTGQSDWHIVLVLLTLVILAVTAPGSFGWLAWIETLPQRSLGAMGRLVVAFILGFVLLLQYAEAFNPEPQDQ